MNTATTAKSENDAEHESADRRRGMRLVSGKRSGREFRIEIADDMFDDARCEERSIAEPQPTSNAVLRDWEPSKLPMILAVAAVAGILLGYLVGRQSDN